MGCQFQDSISVALIQRLDSLDWGSSEGAKALVRKEELKFESLGLASLPELQFH